MIEYHVIQALKELPMVKASMLDANGLASNYVDNVKVSIEVSDATRGDRDISISVVTRTTIDAYPNTLGGGSFNLEPGSYPLETVVDIGVRCKGWEPIDEIRRELLAWNLNTDVFNATKLHIENINVNSIAIEDVDNEDEINPDYNMSVRVTVDHTNIMPPTN